MRRSRVIVPMTVLILSLLFMNCARNGDSTKETENAVGDDTQSDDDESFSEIFLKENWTLRSSDGIAQTGETISTEKFDDKDWYPATVPTTVLAALVDDGVYPDPYFGMNFHEIPGHNWAPFDVSVFPMPPGSPFRHSWWFRTTFELPGSFDSKTIWLRFDGVNFRANVWLNGSKITDSTQVAGTFRAFEFDISGYLVPGGKNCLAIELFPQNLDDLGMNWVDWNPMPPDRNMGIWREVRLLATGPVALRAPQVITKLDLPSLDVAHLTVNADLENATEDFVRGTLIGNIGDIELSQAVDLKPLESRTVSFSPHDFPQLNVKNPKLWWPARLGPQNLQDLDIRIEIDGRVSSRKSIRFGIRQVDTYLTHENYRVFKINGKDLFVRGGAWSPDILLRPSDERDEADVLYALDLNLNVIRLEGKPVTQHFLDLCDRYGVMIMAGWCCCDHWEGWLLWDDEDRVVAAESLRNQARSMRHHASVLTWLNGSDGLPPAEIERMYLDVLAKEQWPDAVVSSAKSHCSIITGPSGVKMTGPYEYVPPVYWYQDTERGGAFGFNTETGPGPSIMPVESLKRFLPADHMWPINQMWNFHAGRGWYMQTNLMTKAIRQRLGMAKGLEDYVSKAQAIGYDNHRAMFEAYRRNKYHSTGVVQWMMNNGWPMNIWHLYDYYLRPAGSYFGAKKGCEMLHVQYSYDDRSIVVVNGYYDAFPGMKVEAHLYNLDLSEKFSQEKTADVGADSSMRVFTVPEIAGLTKTYFLRLTLDNASGTRVSDNFYWLSTKPVIMGWAHGTDGYTPTIQDADLTDLVLLPRVSVNVTGTLESSGDERKAHITVDNASDRLAFFIQMRLTQGGNGRDVAPIFWEDNYFSLMPGEKKEIAVSFREKNLNGKTPVLSVTGWNVEPVSISLQ